MAEVESDHDGDVGDQAKDLPPEPKPQPLVGCTVDHLLRLLASTPGASDLHLSVDLPPVIRINGKLFQAPHEVFTPTVVQGIVYDILTDEQIETLESTHELDFSYSPGDGLNFDVNVFIYKSTVAAAFMKAAAA